MPGRVGRPTAAEMHFYWASTHEKEMAQKPWLCFLFPHLWPPLALTLVVKMCRCASSDNNDKSRSRAVPLRTVAHEQSSRIVHGPVPGLHDARGLCCHLVTAFMLLSRIPAPCDSHHICRCSNNAAYANRVYPVRTMHTRHLRVTAILASSVRISL